MTRRSRVWGGIAVTAVALGLLGGAFAVASAQSQPDTPRPERREGDRAQRPSPMARFVARLAENLGISEDTLRAGIRKTMEELRPQGRGDQEGRPGGMRGRFWRHHGRPGAGDDGQPFGPGPRRGFGPSGAPDGFGRGEDGLRFRPGPAGALAGPITMGIPPVAIVRSVADLLSLTPDELRAELRAGKAIGDVVRERGLSPETLAAEIAARAEQLRAQNLQDAIQRFLERPARPAPSQP